MRRRQLEMQSDRIEAVLASHKVTGRVWGATITPRFIRFQVTTTMGTKVSKVSELSEEIALSLGVRSARVYRKQGRSTSRCRAISRSRCACCRCASASARRRR
jgi:DNA segregation ATPase FtsK/SpoIIIE-like protein